MLGLVTIFSSFLASILLVGCGESISSPPLSPEDAKKTAKYRELHPEEFRPAKTKAVKRRRG
jgi:hypothetical protein